MDNVYVFSAKIYKFGTDEVLEECQVLAYNLFQANHILIDYLFGDEDGKYNIPIEIGEIVRLRNVNNLINPEFILDADDEGGGGYSGNIPLKIAENLTDENTISFTCECHEKLRVPANMGFPFVTCSNCGLDIKSGEIKNVGGIYFYQKLDEKK